MRPTRRPNGSVALNGHAPRIRAGVDPRRVVHDGRNGRAPDGDGQGLPGETIRRAATGTPRRTILLIALLTAVFAASVALAAGWLAGVFAAFAGSIVVYTVTGVATRREAAQEAAIAAAQRAAVGVAVAALGERDGATADHSDDVVELAAALGDRMRVDDEERRRLLVAAQLHDLGKVAVPTEILHKPGPLDDDEWEVMRSHTPVGERILRSVPELADVATIVRHSHEHYDGSGYPDGLAGRQIPLSSRIILCADAYHAIRSNRPYRAGRSAAEALTEIRTHAGRQFDPQVAAALEHAASDARRGQVLRGASLTGSRRLAALLLVLSIGSGAAMAADGPARSMIEDVYAAGPITTSHNPTAPGQPCLLLDPSSAVCAPGLPVLTGSAPGLARARSVSGLGGGQASRDAGAAAGSSAAGPAAGHFAAVSGASSLPVVGVVLPEWAARPPVGVLPGWAVSPPIGAIGSPAVGGSAPGSGASPGLPVAPVGGAADPRPVIWPGTPAAVESQEAGGPVVTPGTSGIAGTSGANGTTGTPGGGTPGGGSAPAPGAVPGGVGDDRAKRRGKKGRRGRERGGDRRRDGGHADGVRSGGDGDYSLGGGGRDDDRRGGNNGGERGKGDGSGGAPSGGGGNAGQGGGGSGGSGTSGSGGGGNGNGGDGGGGSGGKGKGG